MLAKGLSRSSLVREAPLYICSTEGFFFLNQVLVLYFFKYFLCIRWDDSLVVHFQSLNLVNYED